MYTSISPVIPSKNPRVLAIESVLECHVLKHHRTYESTHLPSGNLTWPWKMAILSRSLITGHGSWLKVPGEVFIFQPQFQY